jgi:3D (Asp-Asp-Asp) domain-containing protein
MRLSRRSLLKLRMPALLLATISLLLLATAGALRPVRPAVAGTASAEALPLQSTVLWHAGNFRYLDSVTGDLLGFVQTLTHPNSGGYGKVSTTRKANFNAFLDSLFAAIDASLADGSTGDWCGVKTKAANAGYAIRRFYDTTTGRWFIYGYDTTGFGQSYFFINPFAKRNIVIEVPHEDYEFGTKAEGVRLFRALAARALIINKEHRCSDPDQSACSIGQSTSACSDGRIRESDVAHHTANTFYLLHARYTDMDAATKFVQLHGMLGSASDMAEVGDGTNNIDSDPNSISVRFTSSLDQHVPTPSAADSCQGSDNHPSNVCGDTNVEGRYTNGHDTSSCPAASSNATGRFLHIEQAASLRDDDDSDGWYWGDVRDALLAVWPDCNMNNGASDCTLGSQQTQYSTLTCPSSTTLSEKVTFYGWPDNDNGSGAFGTNVIAYSLTWQGHSRHTNAQGNPVAGGVGTFDDPITVAAASGNSTLPPGTCLYVPGLKKYLLVEDICGNCTTNWIDLWMESNGGNNAAAVTQCEDNWTGDDTVLKDVWLNPSSSLQVDTTPFFNVSTGQCNPVTW